MKKYALLSLTAIALVAPLGAMADTSTGVDISITLVEEASAVTRSNLEFGTVLLRDQSVAKSVTIDPLSGEVSASEGAQVVTAGHKGVACTNYYAGLEMTTPEVLLYTEGSSTPMSFTPVMVGGAENVQAAESTIRDTDMAAEMTGSGNSLNKLSSGYKINRAADDAAGLGVNNCYYIGGTVEIPANAALGTYHGQMVVQVIYDDITSVGGNQDNQGVLSLLQ